jgi:hypothetical protein
MSRLISGADRKKKPRYFRIGSHHAFVRSTRYAKTVPEFSHGLGRFIPAALQRSSGVAMGSRRM